ncbi:hypothetical protein E5D57_010977 [Metarhizium anisopliae]|nr:hypothetical protein E5D57_010977 [Metarhizium anisopliae]
MDRWHGKTYRYGREAGDQNVYKTGRMGSMDVVLLRLANMGGTSAAISATNLSSSFPNLRRVFVTGICAGIPFRANGQEILLGDVIISKSIIAPYENGRLYKNRIEMRQGIADQPGRPPRGIRNLVETLDSRTCSFDLEKQAADFLQRLQERATKRGQGREYTYPGTANDKLFQADYLHKHSMLTASSSTCAECQENPEEACHRSQGMRCEELGCSDSHLVRRHRLQAKESLGDKRAQAPALHFGCVASCNNVVKSGIERDRLAKDHGIVAIEMEAIGICDVLPCIVVKGVADYADSHKNKSWRNFSAAAAASVTKAILVQYAKQTTCADDVDIGRQRELVEQSGGESNVAKIAGIRTTAKIFVIGSLCCRGRIIIAATRDC